MKNGLPDVRTPANSHLLPKRTLNNNLNIVPASQERCDCGKGCEEKILPAEMEIFLKQAKRTLANTHIRMPVTLCYVGVFIPS